MSGAHVGHRTALHWLIPFWLALQMFLYGEMSPLLTFEVGFSLTPDRMLFLLIAGLFSFHFLTGRIRPLPWDAVDTSILCFTALATFSYFVIGGDTEASVNRWLTTLFTLAYFPFFGYFMAKNMVFDKEDIKAFLKALYWIGAYLAFTGVFEHLRWDQFVWPSYILDPTVGIQFSRLRGPFASAVEVGGMLIVVFLCCSLLLTVTKSSSRRFVLYGLLAVLAGCIYLTSTRGIWLAFALALGVMFVGRTPMRRVSKLLGVAILIGFFSGYGAKFSFSEGTLFSKRLQTIEYRMDNFKVAFEVFANHPLVGIGYGRLGGKSLARYGDKFLGGDDMDLTDGNHNLFLGLLAEMGLPGLATYLAIFGFLALRFRGYYLNLPEDRRLERGLVLVAFAVMLQFGLMGQSGDLRFHRMLNSTMFVLFGIVSGLAVREGAERSEEGVSR